MYFNKTHARTHQNVFQDLLEPWPIAADPVDQGVEQRSKDLGLLVRVRGESWKNAGQPHRMPYVPKAPAVRDRSIGQSVRLQST